MVKTGEIEVSGSEERESSQMASLFREDTQNMEAGGEALRGVQTADVKTVKQPVSVSAASQSWWSCDMVKTGKIKVSGSEGRESSQTTSVREDTQNMEAGGIASVAKCIQDYIAKTKIE